MQPTVFVGSSSEGYDFARAVEVVLREEAAVTLWRNGPFGLNKGTLESLVDAAESFDFAVLVLTPDDVTRSREDEENSPRDNVLFEAGLFMGSLGRERTFILYPHDVDMKLPSDLAGVTLAGFEWTEKRDKRDAVSPACFEVINHIQELGSLGAGSDLGNHSLREALGSMVENLRAAMEVNHPCFREEVESRFAEWRLVSREWAQGKIVVRDNYESILSNIYRHANSKIFSTSIPQYRNVWLSRMGKSLVRIQQQNTEAASSRVFIFDTMEDIEEEDAEVFDEQEAMGVEVLIYLDREDPAFLFPSDVGTDWTIVDDGEAIGVTRQMGEIYEAQWYFNDSGQADRFRGFERRMRLGSMTLEQWRERKNQGATG